MQRLDELDKAAKNADVDPETLQTWRLFGQTVGATEQQIDTSLRRLRRRTGEALQGGEVANSFRQLGIDTEFLSRNQDNLSAIVFRVSEELAKADDRTQAFASTVRILDIEGARLATGLIDSGDEFGRLADRARELGAIFPNELIPQITAAKDELTLATVAVRNQKDLLAVEFTPAIENLARVVLPFWIQQLRAAKEAVGDLFDTRANEEARDELEKLRRVYDDVRTTTSQLKLTEEGRRNILREQQQRLERIIELETQLGLRRREAANEPQQEPVDQGQVAANDEILNLALRQIETERRNRAVKTEVLNIKLREGEITQEIYNLEVARLNNIVATTAEERKILSLRERAEQALKAEEDRASLSQEILELKLETNRISEDEFFTQLEKLRGIEREKETLESIQTVSIDITNQFETQIDIFQRLTFQSERWDNSLRGVLTAALDIAQAFAQLSGLQQGGGGGFFSNFGRIFSGGGSSPLGTGSGIVNNNDTVINVLRRHQPHGAGRDSGRRRPGFRHHSRLPQAFPTQRGSRLDGPRIPGIQVRGGMLRGRSDNAAQERKRELPHTHAAKGRAGVAGAGAPVLPRSRNPPRRSSRTGTGCLGVLS